MTIDRAKGASCIDSIVVVAPSQDGLRQSRGEKSSREVCSILAWQQRAILVKAHGHYHLRHIGILTRGWTRVILRERWLACTIPVPLINDCMGTPISCAIYSCKERLLHLEVKGHAG